MARLYYRGMADKDGKPRLGRSARLLGVRLGVDIDVVLAPQDWLDAQSYLQLDTAHNSAGAKVEVAVKNTKGLSVSLSIEGLPVFRKPSAFGGTGRDPLWQIDNGYITGDLEAVQDSPTHVSIMPSATMLLARYEAAIAQTQMYWKRVN